MATAKTVLITGATRGVGLELAKHYAKAGWKLIGAARNPDKADQLRALQPYKVVQLDTSNEDSVKQAAKELEGEVIDLVINNAGILKSAPFLKTTKADLMEQFEVNTVGPFLVTVAFQPHLAAAAKKNGSATVATISSIFGSMTAIQYSGVVGYQVSKAAVNMVMVNAARDLKKDGIIALALHPGYVKTEMNGGDGDITADVSAAGLANVIAKSTIADTGSYKDWEGKTITW